MGCSKTVLRLPVIDFSKQEFEWESVKGKVRTALEEFGAFEALFEFDGIPDRKGMFGAFEEMFNLPLETKQRNVCKNTFSYGPFTYLPLYENLTVEEADTIEKIDQGFINVLWPEGKPELSKAIQSFKEHVAKLDKIIRKMILESFGLHKYIDEHLASTTYTFRSIKYKCPQSTESNVGLPPHKDGSFLSILCQLNQVNGLGLQTKDEKWIDVKFTPNSFIVLIGESLHAWLNGRVPAPYHRVMMSGDKERYSMGLFSYCKEGCIIKAPKELVDEEYPLLYKPYEHTKYFELIKKHQIERKFRPTLKDYCGV